MHHCNIDRLTAMYQAVFPDRQLTPQPAAGTFARRVSDDDVDDMTTPLAPFRKADASYFTSADVSSVQSIWDFGYAYTEVPVSFRNDPSGLTAFTTSQINALYRDSSTRKLRRRGGETSRREWIVHLTFNANEIPGSVQISILFNDKKVNANNGTGVAGVAAASASGIAQPTGAVNGTSDMTPFGFFVGSTSSFHDAGMGGGMVMNTTGAVYITDALLEFGIKSLDPKDVVPFLKTKLIWIARLGGGDMIPLSSLPSLKVGVSSSLVQYPVEDTKLPVYGSFETHYDVTENKKAGFTKGDQKLVDSTPAAPVPGGDVPKDSNDYPVTSPPAFATTQPAYAAPAASSPAYADTYVRPPAHASVGPKPWSEVKNGITTVHVTVTTTVCPTYCKRDALPATNAFESIYSTATKPDYDVFRV